MKRYIPLFVTAVLVLVGCGKREDAAPIAPEAVTAQQGSTISATPVPDRPDPNVPPGTAPELPKPGQANDHSSPEFKGGGTSDRK